MLIRWFKRLALRSRTRERARVVACFGNSPWRDESDRSDNVGDFADERLKVSYHIGWTSVDAKVGDDWVRVFHATWQGRVTTLREGCWMGHLDQLYAKARGHRDTIYENARAEEYEQWSPVKDC